MSGHMARPRLPALVFAVSLLWSPAYAACGAEGFVTNAGNAFFAAARAKSPQAFTNAASRYADLRSIALFSLGQHRKKLPKAREAEYIALTRIFVGKFMAQYSARLSGSNLKVTSCSTSGKALLLKASASGGKTLSFRVTKGKGGYRVQDVSVSSFWLAAQMRSKFVSVINSGGGDIDALFKYLNR